MEIDTKENLIDLDWQVGSKTPPKVCLCCGMPFDSEKRTMLGPYYEAPYIYICRDCHDKDYLHAPDKAYAPVDLKVVAENMKKSLKAARNENIFDQTLPLTEKDQQLPGFTNFEGRKVQVPLHHIPLADLMLDPDNVRFRHIGQDLTDARMEKLVWEDPTTVMLYKDIRNTLGIIEPLFVNADNVVIEGNRRLVCLRRLAREIRNDVLRKVPIRYIDPVPCRVIPDLVSEADKDEFLARIHVGGKKPWRTLDQAFHLHELANKHGKSITLLAEMTGLTEKMIKDAIKAYELTSEYHKRHQKDKEWVSKYSYFLELNKRTSIAKWISRKENLHKVMQWIATSQIAKGDEVRVLSKIVPNKIAMRQMNNGAKIKDALNAISVKSRPFEIKPQETVLTNSVNTKQSVQQEQLTMDFFFGVAAKVIPNKKSTKVLTSKEIAKLQKLKKSIDNAIKRAKKTKRRL